MGDEPIPVMEEAPEAEQPEVAPEQTDTRPRDEKGRFAPKVEQEPKVEQPQAKPEAEQPAEQQQQVERQERDGGIPAWRLREEAEARREWQSKAEKAAQDAENARRELAAIQQRMSGIERQFQEKQNPPPDRYADPDGYDRYQAAQYQMALRQQASAFSEQLARVKFGDELYDKADREAMRYFQENPHDPIFQIISNSSQPAFEVVKWFQQRETQQRLGGKSLDDLLKEHSEKLLEDPAYLARAIEKAKATAKPVQSTANTNIPSLNRATAAAGTALDEDSSDGDFLKSLLPR